MKKQRTTALIVSVLILMISLFSIFFIVEEGNHDCTGQDCPICACMQQAEQVIRNLGTGLYAAETGVLIVSLIYGLAISIDEAISVLTPVNQKVRMNN